LQQEVRVGKVNKSRGKPSSINNQEINKMTTFNIKAVDSFPEITRTGRTSEELKMIINSLEMSSKTGTVFSIEAVEAGKKFNSLQQRIRSQAKKLNLRVTIHFDSNANTLFFKASSEAKVPSEKSVSAKDVKSVKTVSKTNA
jgi:hypothetical protein